MAFLHLRAANFKSFDELDLDLGSFCVILGANASGKSNLIQAFAFIKDIANFGLLNAVSMQGGPESLRNITLGSSTELEMSVTIDDRYRLLNRRKNRVNYGIVASKITYHFRLAFTRSRPGFKVVHDSETLALDFYELTRHKQEWVERTLLGQGHLNVSRGGTTLFTSELLIPPEVPLNEQDIVPPGLRQLKLGPRMLLLETTASFVIGPYYQLFENIGIYDLDPKAAKKAQPVTGKRDLETDGSNLAIALRAVLEEPILRRRFHNLLNDVLSFVSNLRVEQFVDKSLLLQLREIYHPKVYLSASMLSDGTISIIALILALYFETNKEWVILEEIERNIHPYLIERVVQMAKEASESRQIIVTTHAPEVVRSSGLDSLYLVCRNSDGFSRIVRPKDSTTVQVFLQEHIGLDELYVRNLLTA